MTAGRRGTTRTSGFAVLAEGEAEEPTPSGRDGAGWSAAHEDGFGPTPWDWLIAIERSPAAGAVIAAVFAAAYLAAAASGAGAVVQAWLLAACAVAVLSPGLGVVFIATTLAVREPGLLAPYPLSVALVVAALVGTGLRWRTDGQRPRLGLPAGVLLGFTAVSMFSLLWALRTGVDPEVAVSSWANLAIGIGVFFVVALLPDPMRRTTVLLSLAAGALAGIVALLPAYLDAGAALNLDNLSPGRLMGPTHGADILGSLEAVVVAFGLALALFERPARLRVAGLGMAALASPALFLTYSRSSLLALLLGLLIAAGGAGRRRTMAIVLGLGLASLLLVPWFIGQRLTTSAGQNSAIAQQLLADSDSLRIRAWITGIRMAVEQPLTGVGFDAYNTVKLQYGGPPELHTPHNDAIRFFAEMGVPGGILAVLFIVLVATWGWRRRSDRFDLAALAGCVTFVVASQFNAHSAYIEASIPFWILAGWVTSDRAARDDAADERARDGWHPRDEGWTGPRGPRRSA